jgi:hypothetical protein
VTILNQIKILMTVNLLNNRAILKPDIEDQDQGSTSQPSDANDQDSQPGQGSR